MAWMKKTFFATATLAALLTIGVAQAETPEEWVKLGARIHGAFGGFIPVGIRIGEDALRRLHAEPRDVSVIYYNGNAPCPCVVDGIMLATNASPGQGTLQVAADKAPDGTMGVAVIKHRKTGATVKYVIPASWLPKILDWNKLEPMARYDAAMKADGLFVVESKN